MIVSETGNIHLVFKVAAISCCALSADMFCCLEKLSIRSKNCQIRKLNADSLKACSPSGGVYGVFLAQRVGGTTALYIDASSESEKNKVGRGGRRFLKNSLGGPPTL